ncbi:MAG: DUF4234 domain-containing protein [Erysipelotrichaceae bacterium]
MVRKKNIVSAVLLSIFTCGLYFWYWVICLTNDIAILKNDNKYRSGGLVVFLSLFTCGIYFLYWVYVTSRDIYKLELAYDNTAADNSTLNVILAIFAASVVSLSILQLSINRISDKKL